MAVRHRMRRPGGTLDACHLVASAMTAPTEGESPEEWADAVQAATLGIDESPPTEGGDDWITPAVMAYARSPRSPGDAQAFFKAVREAERRRHVGPFVSNAGRLPFATCQACGQVVVIGEDKP